MSEAIKIVKAKLNDALNRNDGKAVREACIVLKAMEGYVITDANAEDIKEVVSNDPNAKVEQKGLNVYLETDDTNIPVMLKGEGYTVKNYQPEKQLLGDEFKQLKELIKSGGSDEKIKALLKDYSDKDINYYIDLVKQSNDNF